MPQPISPDLRQRIFAAVQAGESTTEAAERFAVSPAFVRRLMQRHRETQSLAPKTRQYTPVLKLAGREDEIAALLAARPGITAGEVRRKLGVPCCTNTVWRMIRRLDHTFKKRASAPPNRSDRTLSRSGGR
jgi:transposase